jgi:hypothetical protein
LEKGESVKKYFTFIFALLVLFGVQLTAHAQMEGTVVATIPFEFIAAGKTLPAGTYTVSRASSGSELLISSRDNGVFVIPVVQDSTPVDTPLVSFDKVSDAYFLHEVTTPQGTFLIDTHREESKLGQAKQHDGMTSSGSH